MVKRHLEEIVNAVVLGATHARSEEVNAKIQWIKHTARGFSKRERCPTLSTSAWVASASIKTLRQYYNWSWETPQALVCMHAEQFGPTLTAERLCPDEGDPPKMVPGMSNSL